MGNFIQKGYTYTSGSPNNQVTASNLNQLVDSATILPTAITALSQKTTPDGDDTVMVSDSANGGALKKVKFSSFPSGGSTDVVTGTAALAPFRNLKIANNGGSPQTTLDITVDEITLATGSGTPTYLRNITASANITVSGAGGLDTGSEAGSTFYYVYAIHNGTLTKGLLSTSGTSPNLPSGYTYFGLIGLIYNDIGSSFVTSCQLNRQVAVKSALPIQSNTAAATSWVAVSTAPALIPPIAHRVWGIAVVTTSTDLVVSIGGVNDHAAFESMIGVATSGNATDLLGTGSSTCYAAGNWSCTLTTAQTIYYKTSVQTTHLLLYFTGYEL